MKKVRTSSFSVHTHGWHCQVQIQEFCKGHQNLSSCTKSMNLVNFPEQLLVNENKFISVQVTSPPPPDSVQCTKQGTLLPIWVRVTEFKIQCILHTSALKKGQKGIDSPWWQSRGQQVSHWEMNLRSQHLTQFYCVSSDSDLSGTLSPAY